MKIKYSFIHKQSLFGLLINKLLPLDKITIILYTTLNWLKKKKLSRLSKQCIFLTFLIPLFSFIINFPNSSFQIFYPFLFFLGAILVSNKKIKLSWIRNIIFINIIIGIIAVVFSFLGYENIFSFSLKEKALPFIYAPYGFSPTQQVYGTLCIIFLIISFERKIKDYKFYITILATLLTLNRCTLLFFFLIIFLYKRKIFYTLSICILFLIIKYWDIIENVLFSTSTLTSRSDLRKGAELSFWQSQDLMVYIFGRGNTNVTETIASKTIWGRSYIEHGFDFILHCYGFLGTFIILSMLICFILNLAKKKQWKYFFICSFYFLFEQLLTHELLASSFFFVLTTILILSKQYKY